ncbi:hypothetical protein KC356_g4230 [Hortaea werneckii]|nr:hypothetical protein KC356_g4230 [Hortaea werneckii]
MSTSILDSRQLLQAAKLIAVPLPFALAGYSYAFSQNAVPALYDQPAEVSTPAIKDIYQSGAKFVVPGNILSLAATAYLAWKFPAQRSLWATAAGSLVALIAWTPLVMRRSNIVRLLEISESKALQEKATATLEARQLLIKWVRQNYVRAALAFAAGVYSVRATLA